MEQMWKALAITTLFRFGTYQELVNNIKELGKIRLNCLLDFIRGELNEKEFCCFNHDRLFAVVILRLR